MGGRGDKPWVTAPRRDPGDAALDADHAPAGGGAGIIILIHRIVMGTERYEVFLVRGTAGGPGGEVVDLGVIGRRGAAGPRADGMLRAGQHALFPAGQALGAIQIYRAVLGVDQADVTALGEGAGNELGAGHARAVGKLKHDVIALANSDAI